ncbi:hypothetical protein D3C73_1518280 [compost metagenome]
MPFFNFVGHGILITPVEYIRLVNLPAIFVHESGVLHENVTFSICITVVSAAVHSPSITVGIVVADASHKAVIDLVPLQFVHAEHLALFLIPCSDHCLLPS